MSYNSFIMGKRETFFFLISLTGQENPSEHEYALKRKNLISLKVNEFTFRKSNSVIFIVSSQINWAHLIKERICSHRIKFFPIRADPILGELRPPGKQRGSHENCLPLKTWRKKM